MGACGRQASRRSQQIDEPSESTSSSTNSKLCHQTVFSKDALASLLSNAHSVHSKAPPIKPCTSSFQKTFLHPTCTLHPTTQTRPYLPQSRPPQTPQIATFVAFHDGANSRHRPRHQSSRRNRRRAGRTPSFPFPQSRPLPHALQTRLASPRGYLDAQGPARDLGTSGAPARAWDGSMSLRAGRRTRWRMGRRRRQRTGWRTAQRTAAERHVRRREHPAPRRHCSGFLVLVLVAWRGLGGDHPASTTERRARINRPTDRCGAIVRTERSRAAAARPCG